MARQLNYSKRDFNSLKVEQINYIRQYYPNLLENFNDAGILSVLLDLNAAIADNLHYHIDKSLHETVLDYAQETKSLYNIAKTYGLKLPGKSASVAVCQFSVQVPPYGDEEDRRYLPVLSSSSQFSSGDTTFELMHDIDFKSNNNINGVMDRTKTPIFSDGLLVGYRITKTGLVIAGTTRIYTQVITNNRPFYQITLPENDVLSIESVIHKNGITFQTLPTISEFNNSPNKWHEVPSLIEDMVFVQDKSLPPQNGVYYGKYETVDRRFIKEFTPNGFCLLTFGSQTNLGFDVLDDFIDNGSFNLKNVLNNNSLGLAPINNTTMFVRYRIGGGENTNVGVGVITTVGNIIMRIDGPNSQTRNIVENSLDVVNITPAIGGSNSPTIEELRHFISYNFAAQNRAVTLQDYKVILMGMPTKFGVPAKTSVTQNKNKVNVNLLSKDQDGHLSGLVNSAVMDNVANYLSRYRMINDYVVVKPAKVINIGFEVDVLIEDGFSVSIIPLITNEITQEFKNMDIGFNLILGKLVKRISQINGVLSINSIKVLNKVGSDYSVNRLSPDRIINTLTNEVFINEGILNVLGDEILQIKFPEKDILITTKIQNNNIL